MIDFQIPGGIALTIFGARFLRKGMDRLFGSRMMEGVTSAIEKPHRALVGGLVAGVLVPSSTGLSLTALHLAEGRDGREADLGRILLLLLAAHAGTTVTVQLLAFNLQGMAGLLLFAGLVMFQLLRREVLRGIGQCLLSLGFIFLAMQLIGQGAREAAKNPELSALIGLLAGHPGIIAALGALVVVALQSSTASISLLLAYAASGVSNSALMMPWVAGVNAGICATTLLLGWSLPAGRRIGFGALSVKSLLAVAIVALPLQSAALFEMMPGSLARKVAMAHTLVNLLALLLGLLLARPLEKWMAFLVPPAPASHGPSPESLLDELLLDTPPLALARATRQTLLLADRTRGMLGHFWSAYKARDLSAAPAIRQEDNIVDRMNLEIADYLSRLREGKSAEDSDRQVRLLSVCNELESIGDIIDRNLLDLLRKILDANIGFTREDRALLDEAYDVVRGRFEEICAFIPAGRRAEVRGFLARRDALTLWFDGLMAGHHARMSASPTPIPRHSTVYLDFLNALRRVNSHLNAIARVLAGPDPGRGKGRTPISAAPAGRPHDRIFQP